MIILINGSFGVGKTTVAKILRRQLAGSSLYDPERAGLVLMRVPKWFGLKGGGTGDFQDIALWRKFTIAGIRSIRAISSSPVIVPMTFTSRDYFDEVSTGIRRYDNDVRPFCLIAELAVIRARLAARGDNLDAAGSGWLYRRIIECDVAHRDPHFGEPVDTNDLSADDVANYIAKRLGEGLTY